MKNVTNKLRVSHFPQIGSCKKCFIVDVKDEAEAYKIYNVLANQHLWLFKNKIIPDYSNVILVEMFDENIEEETGKPFGWGNYWNEEEVMEWDELEETYFKNVTV
jgi:hypothetical protein